MDPVNPWVFLQGPQYTWIPFAMDTNSFGIQRLTVTTNLSNFNNLKQIYLKKIT